MSPLRHVKQLATFAILIRTAATQPGPRTPTRPTPTASTKSTDTSISASKTTASASLSASSVTSTPGDYTTVIVPVNLYNAIDPLLTQCFPSPTPCGLPAITWPSALTFGSVTYALHSASTASGAASKSTKSGSLSGTPTTDPSHLSSTPTLTNTTTSEEDNGQSNDKRLGIILGVIIGILALAVIALLFWCLLRRRRKAGSFFLRRSTPSPSSIRSRGLGAFGTTLYVSGGTLHVSNGSSSRANMSTTNHDDTPALLRPGPVHRESSRSRSEENAFYTPLEHPNAPLPHHELDGRRMEHRPGLDNHPPSHRRSSNSARDGVPPTPISPIAMQHTDGAGQGVGYGAAQKPPSSPLRAAEHKEADDVVSPILPSKSFERRNSPMIHYPSMDEVNDFDFDGKGKNRVSVDGASGWHPSKQRYDGRHELA